MNGFDIPVVLFVFRRLDTVKMILEQIREVKPKVFYVFSDGPREGYEEEEKKVTEVRAYIKKAVDWECQTHFEFAKRNKGCANNICGGLYTVFEKEPYALVFEDDAVPMKEFFVYSQYLLKKYQNEKSIQFIAGFNAVGDTDTIVDSYAFSKSAPMSGAFATWQDRWLNCDFKMKNWPQNKKTKRFRGYYYFGELYHVHKRVFDESYVGIGDGWDYQFHHDMLDKDCYAIVPKGNLARSYGYVEGAFHPQSKKEAARLIKMMDYTKKEYLFPLQEPGKIVLNREYDRLRQKLYLSVTGNYLERHITYLYYRLKNFAYKYMPKTMWNMLKNLIVR